VTELDPGYHVVDLLDGELIDELRALYDSLDIDRGHDFLATSNDLERADARRVHDRIVDLLADRLEQAVPGHTPFLSGFISKGAASGGPTAFHQDLSYTDERTHRATLLWIPLVDVDEDSGALQVVPGSHRLAEGPRPSGLDHLPTAPLQDEWVQRAETATLRAGQAVVYDAALVHGAHTNAVDTVRPAVAVALAPTGADLVHVHVDADGNGLTGYVVDVDYYMGQGLFHRPVGYGSTEVWGEPVTEQRLRAALGVDRPTEEGSDRVSGTGLGQDRTATATATATTDADAARVLVDPDRDAELRRDGYTVTPFVDPGTISELRAIYAVHHGWYGEGFEPDLNNPDTTYRHAVSERIRALMDERASALFVRHEPFLRVFLCKWPGEHSDLYIHRDWMYTDERQGPRTYVVWIALQDITEHNGPLQVVPGTHRLDPMLRGTDLNASWLAHQEVLAEHMVQVTARAGDALIFDNQLIHASPPNLTAEPRLVTAIGMKDRDAPLVYFHRRDEESADRYDVDEEFFLTETPGALLQRPPDREVVETVTVTGRDLTAEELTAILERDRPRRPVDRLVQRLPLDRLPRGRLRARLERARGSARVH
jgi:ectoine hydroxylase-related dioxygenase (phytanoyl-CoA dioxygenase family)